ncbi:YgaB family protein, partial [Bacillus sp. SIMBA_005]
DAKLDNVQDEIATKRKDLAGIQELFQRQTEQVIQSYRSTEKPSSYVQK